MNGHSTMKKGSKKAPDHKMVQNLKPLVDDKSKFRQWNLKFINAMTDYNPLYGRALNELMMWADTEALPDFSSGWPGNKLGVGKTAGLNVEKFEDEVRCVLVDKADGDIHTRITNARGQGGAYIYADMHRWLTETSGLGLAEQANKLMNPPPAKREDLIAECIEQWEEKCSRLANYGSEHELPEVYKTAALKKILVGEAVRNFDLWSAEKMPYGKLILKLKDFARNKKLDTESSSGKQAVDVSRVTGKDGTAKGKQEENEQGEGVEEISAVSNVKCYWCQKGPLRFTMHQEARIPKGQGQG